MDIIINPDKKSWTNILQRPQASNEAISGKVIAILEDVKRNGDTEPFTPGRIALAVFRAAQAQKSDSMPATKSRLLGSQVSNLAAVKILEMGANRIEIESIQDVVVDVLMEVGCSDLAATYQEYRSS